MKTFKFIAVMTLMLLTSLASNAQRLFTGFGNDKYISTVYISPAAMRLGLSLGEGIGSKKDSDMTFVKDAIKNPQGMEIVSAETKAASDKVKAVVDKEMKKLGMELLLETREGDEMVNIYTGRLIKDSIMKDVLIETIDGNEYTVIYVKGEVDVNVLSNMK